MKLQNLSIIFIVIMVPIILIVSYYLSLQKLTLTQQISYDKKLLESTKEAIEAFEINTTEWNSTYSNLSDSKRRDVMASINTFITSMSNSLGMGGVAKENILSYIPAIAFTLYDGYYIYSPSYIPPIKTDANGMAMYKTNDDGTKDLLYDNGTTEGTINLDDLTADDYKYEHTLTTYLPYSKKYSWGTDNNIIIDYTLDNYIRVYGTLNRKCSKKIRKFSTYYFV